MGAGLAELMARLRIGDEVLREPGWITPADSWLGHAPFAFWLMRVLRPEVMVEWSGASCVSWFGCCQAIEADGLGTQATALGGWTAAKRRLYRVSDPDRWFEAQRAQYAGFATVPRTGVAEGRTLFADGSIDLLVIRQGAAELAGWLPALSPRAVVLVQPAAGPVDGARFRFEHSGGLTLIGVGAERPPALAALFGLGKAETALARRFFAARGAACEARGDLAAERARARALAAGFEAQALAMRQRQKTEIATARRDVSVWLERALHNYERWRLRREEELRGEVEDLKGALARAEVEREGAREAVRSVMASTSWRVTKPLRLAAGLRHRGAAPVEGGQEASASVGVEREVDHGVLPAVPPVGDGRVELPDLFALRSHVAASRVAVVLHIGEAAYAEAALGWLERVAVEFDLFVTLVEDRSDHLLPMLGERFPGVRAFAFPDQGRDVLPFLTLAGSGALFGYALVGKLVAHGGEAPSTPVEAAAVLAGFDAEPDLGMVTDHGAYWLRPFVLRDVVGAGIAPEGFEADVKEAAIALACRAAGLEVRAGWQAGAAATAGEMPRVVAFYLPQFHPIPQNDAWWGAGFTEWRNVTKAAPSFPGHRQPRLPGELGFTDLRVPETRAAQAELARAYGVSAFCYHYYWFGEGRRLLERPLDDVLRSGEPDFPFMICWANEPWSRRWDGGRDDVLMGQEYEDGWEEDFAAEILPLLQDRRYVHLGGRPVILIYRIMHLPRPAESLARLRSRFEALGVGPVHIGAGWFALPGDDALPDDPAGVGCDSYFEFPPHRLPVVPAPAEEAPAFMTGRVFDYTQTVDATLARLETQNDGALHHGVMMGWDNTARRDLAAHVYRGATPCHFRRWLRAVVRHEQRRGDAGEKFVFVNAWNEWAEGTCLEPDRDFGRGWLEAVRSALGRG